MKELLNEWRKFLTENDKIEKDIKFSDDVYAQFVFMYLGDDTDPMLAPKRINKLITLTNNNNRPVIFPTTQMLQAHGEAKQIFKDLTGLFKLLPQQERRYLTKVSSGMQSTPPYFSVLDILRKRANLEENQNIGRCFINIWNLELYKFITIPMRYGEDIRSKEQLHELVNKLNEDAIGAYDLLEKFRSYKNIANVEDPEERLSLLRLLASGAHDAANTKMVEMLTSSLMEAREGLTKQDHDRIREKHAEQEKERHEKWLKSLSPEAKKSYDALKKKNDDYQDYLEKRKKDHAEYIIKRFPHGRGREPDMPVHGTGKKMWEKRRKKKNKKTRVIENERPVK